MLTFEIRTHLGPILQDVPVTVLSAVRLEECADPETEDVGGFTLPPLAKIHSVVERMKGLGNDLELHATLADKKADLTLKVITDMVTVSTEYKDLLRASCGVGETEPTNQEEHQAVVDRRNFSRCLYGHQLQPRHAICFIFQNSVMVHLMGSEDVAITYYIPQRITLS